MYGCHRFVYTAHAPDDINGTGPSTIGAGGYSYTFWQANNRLCTKEGANAQPYPPPPHGPPLAASAPHSFVDAMRFGLGCE